MFRNIRLPGEDNGLFVFRFQLIPGKKKRKDNLIQSLGPSTKMKKTLSYIQQHWCLAANLKIGIYNGEIIFNRLLRRCALSISDFQQCLGTFESKMPPYSHLQPQKSAKTVT